MYDKPLGML